MLPTYQLDEHLNTSDSLLNERTDGDKLSFLDGLEGTLSELMERGVFGGFSSTAGVEFNIDKAGAESYLQSRNYSQYNAGWKIDSGGNIDGLTQNFGNGGTINFYDSSGNQKSAIVEHSWTFKDTSGNTLGKIYSDGSNTAMFIVASTDITTMLLRTGAASGTFAPNPGTISLGTQTYPWSGMYSTGIITQTEDLIFSGGGSGLSHGSCYGNHIGWSQANATQNTWYNISDSSMIDGNLHNVTHDGNGKLTVTYAGKYLVGYSVCFEDNVANDHIEIGIEVSSSGSANAAGQVHLENKFANEEEHSGSSCILDLAASATIEAAIRTTDVGTPTISVQAVNITCTQIGG